MSNWVTGTSSPAHSPVPSSTYAACWASWSDMALVGFNHCTDRVSSCFLVGATSPQSSRGLTSFFSLLENFPVSSACELKRLLTASPLGIMLKRVFVKGKKRVKIFPDLSDTHDTWQGTALEKKGSFQFTVQGSTIHHGSEDMAGGGGV